MNTQGLIVTCIFLLSSTLPIHSLVNSYSWHDHPHGTNISYGVDRMTDIASLPVLDRHVKVHYEGSIDKRGANADWDWWLYEDDRGEWVIFDVSGPGCIYNFVQHRYPDSEDVVFRFYFDNEDEPRFTVKGSEFGQKYPFTAPLADRYIGPFDGGRGPIRVIRSFIPMPFRDGCRITSSVKLEGHDRQQGHGGWGHVVYHGFDSPDGVETFTGNEDLVPLARMWKRAGTEPCPSPGDEKVVSCPGVVAPSGSMVLHACDVPGVIKTVKLYLKNMDKERLRDVWIKIHFDGSPEPDVYCPIGAFFGNSLGYNDMSMLLMGSNTDGWFYNYFPMPFWASAEISLENRSNDRVEVGFAEVTVSANNYDVLCTGYFRNTPYYTRKYTPGADSRIGEALGTGKIVAVHVSAHGERSNIITCEGDVRLYIDGNRTPSVESDGSESYICYGWGFPTPAEYHPMGGYDGLSDNPWSMTRLCVGDSYPFHSGFLFGIESGENNNQYLEHSGTVFYYGRNQVTLIETDRLSLDDAKSKRKHKYVAVGNPRQQEVISFFEGDEDDIELKATVTGFDEYSEFNMAVDAANEGVRLRRMSDQSAGRQLAKVYVDGQEVVENVWYLADSNPWKRWVEDEFEIPAKYTAGKSLLRIKIVPESVGGVVNWNEAAYVVLCYAAAR